MSYNVQFREASQKNIRNRGMRAGSSQQIGVTGFITMNDHDESVIKCKNYFLVARGNVAKRGIVYSNV